MLQDETGPISIAHSVSAGLDYPGIGPEHSYFKDTNRAQYVATDDKGALSGYRLLSKIEGIIPALEPAHAVDYLAKLAPKLGKNKIIVMCLSGRGDKDIDIVREELNL